MTMLLTKSSGGGGDATREYNFYAISKGDIPGSEEGFIVGFNPNTVPGQSSTISDQGGSLGYPTVDLDLFLTSDDVLDIGVTVVIQGLNDQYERITATAVSNGTTPVALNIKMFRFFVALVVGATSPVGNLYIAEADTYTAPGVPDSNPGIKLMIPLTTDGTGDVIDMGTEFASDNISHMGAYTVPAGFSMRITDIYSGTAKNDDTRVGGRLRLEGGVWLNRNAIFIYQGNSRINYTMPLLIPEKSDLEFRAVAGSEGTASSVFVLFVLEAM